MEIILFLWPCYISVFRFFAVIVKDLEGATIDEDACGELADEARSLTTV